MKYKPFKTLWATVALAGTFVPLQTTRAESDTQASSAKSAECPFKDLSEDKDLMAVAVATVMEENFPELWMEKKGADIAVGFFSSTLEDMSVKAIRGDVWEKEDIYTLFHLDPKERLKFFKELEAAEKRIPLTNDEAVLLTDAMTSAQIKEFCAIDTHQRDLQPLTVGALIDSILEICKSPEPLYTNTPKKVIKNVPKVRRQTRIRP